MKEIILCVVLLEAAFLSQASHDKTIRGSNTKGCPPGHHVVSVKSPYKDSEVICTPCEIGRFSEGWSWARECSKCKKVCPADFMETVKECSPTEGRKCRCLKGYYKRAGENYCFERVSNIVVDDENSLSNQVPSAGKAIMPSGNKSSYITTTLLKQVTFASDSKPEAKSYNYFKDEDENAMGKRESHKKYPGEDQSEIKNKGKDSQRKYPGGTLVAGDYRPTVETTRGMYQVLRQMTQNHIHTADEGYGPLIPNNIFQNRLTFCSALTKALKTPH